MLLHIKIEMLTGISFFYMQKILLKTILEQ
jgi:hypothetical protein